MSRIIKAIRDRFGDKVKDIHVFVGKEGQLDLKLVTRDGGIVVGTLKKDDSDLKEELERLATKIN